MAEARLQKAGKRLSGIVKDPRGLLFLIMVAISLITQCINPRFFRITNIISILQQVSVMGMMTMGMVLLLLTGLSDLSIGMSMTLCGVCISQMISAFDNVPLAILVGVTVGALCGLLNGVIVAKTRCLPLIVTIGTSNFFAGLALVISQGRFLNFRGKFNFLRTRIFGVIPLTLFFMLAMVLIMAFIVRRTRFGRRCVTVGSNENAAYLAGINVDFYKIMAYVIMGIICGISSVVFVSRLDSIVADAGSSYSLNVLSAAIIGGVTFEGGRGTILGTVIGVLFIGVISNVMTILNINTYWQTALEGVVVVVAVIASNYSNIKRR